MFNKEPILSNLIVLFPSLSLFSNTNVWIKCGVIWLIVESLFYIHYLNQKKRLQSHTQPSKPLTKSQRTKLYWNCISTIKDVSSWGTGWFYYKKDKTHPPLNEIKRDNILLWFAWGFWHDHLENVMKEPSYAEEIEWMLTTAEEWFQIKFDKGFNPDLACIRLNLDPVESYHRPLLVYLGLYGITFLFHHVYLRGFLGFEHYRGEVWGSLLKTLDRWLHPTTSDALSYYYYPGQGTPLVFVHGIGAGVACYGEFIHQIVSTFSDRPMFLVELPYVSMHMVEHVPSASETVEGIRTLLDHHGFSRAVFIGHSMGTGVISWVMNLQPTLIAGLVMIDPICFLLHYHHVAFNFVHRIPRRLIEYFMHYVVAKELYISHFISRHFQWFETAFFVDQERSCLTNACIFLSEKDKIVGSQDVHQYLVENQVECHMMPGLEHAMFLTDPKWKANILKQIEQITIYADTFQSHQ